MNKRYLQIIIGILTVFSLSYGLDNTFGIVLDEDFYKIGIQKENLDKAKVIMEQSNRDFKNLALERQKLEIDVNQLLLDGAEKNIDRLDAVLDELGRVEASVYKRKIRSQIEIYKFISKDEYMAARSIAITRIQEQQTKEKQEKEQQAKE